MLGDDWLTRMDESGWRIQWPAARDTPQHAADITSATQKKKHCLGNAL
jgi:hypothetical protein